MIYNVSQHEDHTRDNAGDKNILKIKCLDTNRFSITHDDVWNLFQFMEYVIFHPKMSLHHESLVTHILASKRNYRENK